ncbi:MAG TPA: hypothetical protein RMH80_33385, partial [Polyangiaceae bacterium LLY-WYZ-15_(1-7)]|nr:hypothetical protein [Polyangiaceae bacterium LLY-WYZ-15_(1-7)]
WYAFDALHDDAAHLRATIAAQAGSDARIGALAPDELPAPLRVLAERVQAARARYEAYLATGQLEPTPRRTLFAGVHEREREQMLGTLGDALGDLEAGMARHERDLEEVVRGLLTLSDAEARRTRVQARLELVAKSWDERARELAGLLAAQGAEDARLGELTDALASLEGALDAGGLVPVGDTVRWTLSGASATADGVLPRSPDWAELAAAQLRVQPGQVLQLEAQGEWSPTCALRGQQVYDQETRAPLAVEAEGALIGPEGFRLSRSASGWVAEEHSDTTSTTGFLEIGATFQACAGTPGAVQAVTGGSAKACVYANAGARWSATESNTDRHGSDTRTSASFSAGLRVPNAPLPELPVGALLLVEVPPGGRVPRDVHIVRRPRTTVVVSDGEADLYAFVNDTACAGADGTNELVVTARLFEGEDVVARRSLGAIEEVLATIRAQEPTVVAQGRVLPSQLGALRSEAYHRLRAKTGLALGDMPDPMVGLFDAFLSKELLRLERAVAIDQLERELDVLVLELASLHEEVLLLDQQTRLATLIPTWTLRNLDGEELRGLIADVVGLARRYLFPVLELWYPDALARLATNGAFAARLEALRSAGPTTRTLDLVREVRAAMELILSAYRGVLPGYKDEPSRPLVAAAFRDPSRQAGATELSALPKADAARSEVVWRALRDLETGTFTIDPEDVYSRFGGAGGRLACTEAVPVIERMALVVVRNGDDFINQDYNFERRWLSGRASVSQPFVEEDGLVDYTLGNQVWQSFQIPVLYGRPSEPLEAFATRVLDAGGEALPTGPAGLSPFGSLEIDFQGLAALRDAGRDGIVGAGDDAFEVALVMQVDSRSIAEPVDWLAACDPTIDTEPGGEDEPPFPTGGEDEPPFPTGDEPPGDEPPFPTGDEPPFPTF